MGRLGGHFGANFRDCFWIMFFLENTTFSDVHGFITFKNQTQICALQFFGKHKMLTFVGITNTKL